MAIKTQVFSFFPVVLLILYLWIQQQHALARKGPNIKITAIQIQENCYRDALIIEVLDTVTFIQKKLSLLTVLIKLYRESESQILCWAEINLILYNSPVLHKLKYMKKNT